PFHRDRRGTFLKPDWACESGPCRSHNDHLFRPLRAFSARIGLTRSAYLEFFRHSASCQKMTGSDLLGSYRVAYRSPFSSLRNTLIVNWAIRELTEASPA